MHTPQDVIVGILLSVFCLCTVWKIGNYLQNHPEKENTFLFIIALCSIAALIYIIYKPYPMDYIDDKLLVNPKKAAGGAFEAIGALLSFCFARYIEKTWIRFKATGLNLKGIIAGLIGTIPLYLLLTFTEKPLRHFIGYNYGKFVWAAIIVFYTIAFYPLILKLIFRTKNYEK